ncbi:hypothetical protein P171DRAFT_271549 [Karstenula rhodostoma CBS 690.94]|uniref:Uncharacterized protein n=1 Tax=Karstenula rhodostoma CBS 690.94 TaxID=1392251 RepID=A0A9P4PKN6_9PLEO|nr:hypothetical protein P171DRAFT_271549 [Karstenula rhodostoma CBS 690.94]
MCSMRSSRSLKTWKPRHVPLLTTSLRHPDAQDEHMFAYSTVRDRHKDPLSRTSVLLSCALALWMWARGEAQPLRDQPSMTLLLLVYLGLSPLKATSIRSANRNHTV